MQMKSLGQGEYIALIYLMRLHNYKVILLALKKWWKLRIPDIAETKP